MNNYIIKFAKNSDVSKIMDFIGSNWKKNHILANNKELFEWQYINNRKLNFVIGIDTENNIKAILGYIPYGRDDNKDISLALWKTSVRDSFLGLQLLLYLIKNETHKTIFCPGINISTSEGIYKRLNFITGTMNQWYRLSSTQEYKIAKICSHEIPQVDITDTIKTIHFKTFKEFDNIFEYDKYVTKDIVPYKSKEYFKKKYFNNPGYKYMIIGIAEASTNIPLIIVLRIQEYRDSCVLRFIDAIGDYEYIKYATRYIDVLLKEYEAEYIDLYETGLSSKILEEAGWLKVKESGNIIPNYFAPYIQENIDINFCSSDPNIVLFKGDGDQDRIS